MRWERLRKQGTHGVGDSATVEHGYFHKDVKRKDLNVGVFSSEHKIIAFRGKYKNFPQLLQHKRPNQSKLIREIIFLYDRFFILVLDPFCRTDSSCIIFAVTIRPLAFPMWALHERISIKFDIAELNRRAWEGTCIIYFVIVFVLT